MSEALALKLYNTESRKKEAIAARDGETIKMYTCGPTVYNFAHIGNFRTYIFEDLLRRTLKYFGFKLHHVMNLTDIDDKTIRGALAENIALDDFTQPYIDAFFDDLKTLMIEPAEVYPRATEHIPEMIAMIQTLLDKELAYRGSDGSIYYKIAAFPCYGRLSHLNLDELKAGASERVAQDEYERGQISDFALWKAYDPTRDGKIFWESPFGKGRPGWHIECSAMALKHLGAELDIHCGGIDNMFPHHENEIAQSEGCTGHHFVAHWLHSEHLLVNQRKMSKSAGNFYTLRDLLAKGFSGREIRMLLLQTHYKTPLNFTFEGLEAAKSTLNRFDEFIERLQAVSGNGPLSDHLTRRLKSADKAFAEGLADDLNISVSLAALFDLIRDINGAIDSGEMTSDGAHDVLTLLRQFDKVLALLKFERDELAIPDEITQALGKREAARKAKNWGEADKQRDFILMQGYQIVDTPSGPKIKRAER